MTLVPSRRCRPTWALGTSAPRLHRLKTVVSSSPCFSVTSVVECGGATVRSKSLSVSSKDIWSEEEVAEGPQYEEHHDSRAQPE